MANFRIDINRMDRIIKKTIEVINNSKDEIYDIAESARRECQKLEEELRLLKQQVKELVEVVDVLEAELKKSKKRLMLVNKNFHKYTQEELKEAYEKADNLRVELAIRRQQEQYLIKRRNELEVRIKDAYKTVEKADNLITHIGAALSYLTGDLQEISFQLEDIQERQLMGIQIIKAQEEERRRVARDIHDGPAQSMSNVVLKAELCEKLIDIDFKRVKEELRNLKQIARECLQDVRRIIYDLRPMSLDDLGLVPTLQRYISTFQEESCIAVRFKTLGTCDDLRSEISLTVFRIVQEAISNVKKHAKATKVVINLEFLEKDLRLSISDDGIGFDIESLKSKNKDRNSGFGLFSIRERVELLNGEFQITSEEGKGTHLKIRIPLIQEEGDTNE